MRRSRQSSRDHPRSCGEHRFTAIASSMSTGSSPLVRGARASLTRSWSMSRIIPARAGSTSCTSRQRGARWDHPRSCGEHSVAIEVAPISQGSSPLVRGAPLLIRFFCQHRGIIPARAGSTEIPKGEQVNGRDHPRSCGEHQRDALEEHRSEGSSPLVRGAQCGHTWTCRQHRIIPARAGSTAVAIVLQHCDEDHPRSCGEHHDNTSPNLQPRGSSPLVRGARSEQAKETRHVGIIPARAGSTMARSEAARRWWDHPRSCGEHWMGRTDEERAEGSSPLVRGALIQRIGWLCRAGIIPARAGSTCAAQWNSIVKQDHPRSCGEHSAHTRPRTMRRGSSPLVRGARGRGEVAVPEEGIIPARAGSTRSGGCRARRPRDHPRSCGEHISFCSCLYLFSGSSPLVRGALGLYNVNTVGLGIIPARAGSTMHKRGRYKPNQDHPRSCGEHT